jgi:hypothetical protein
MTTPIRILIILGFCAAALGGAGLGKPADGDSINSDYAWILFCCGTLALVTGGVLQKLAKKKPGGTGTGDAQAENYFSELLEKIRWEIHSLDDSKKDLSEKELITKIEDLLKTHYFNLTSRHEELAALLGFSKYAEIWDGVASAERLLSRTWSMATDGHLEEAIEEIPRARAQIERACAAMGVERQVRCDDEVGGGG